VSLLGDPWAFFGTTFAVMFYRAMVLLVVSTRARRRRLPRSCRDRRCRATGHPQRGGGTENMAEVTVAVFDKTGTLTTGKPASPM
jgi:cation transport ATPase